MDEDTSELQPKQFVYIDESGHTGDLLIHGNAFGFSGQPHFVLSAVGPISPDAAATLLFEVADRHRLKMHEVKSYKLDKRPGVALDLASGLRALGVPLFVEAVDKRFFLVVEIVNCHVFPPTSGAPLDESDRYVRCGVADLLYELLPDSLLESFVAACRLDTAAAVQASLESLHAWTESFDGADAQMREVLDLTALSVADSLDDLRIELNKNPGGYRFFLPLPDAGKRDATFWILPHYSSLTNLYARLNRYFRGKLSDVVMVHDVQTQYEGVLRSAKSAVENFVDPTSYAHPGASYSFSETADLSFETSDTTPALMIADVIAGHVRRILRDAAAQTSLHPGALDAFLAIWEDNDLSRGAGINFVLPTAAIQRLQQIAILREQSR